MKVSKKGFIPLKFVKEGEIPPDDSDAKDCIPSDEGALKKLKYCLRPSVSEFDSEGSSNKKKSSKKGGKKVEFIRKPPIPVNRQLHIKFPRRRPPKDEVAALHPAIISVTEPKRKKDPFCVLTFETVAIAQKALKELREIVGKKIFVSQRVLRHPESLVPGGNKRIDKRKLKRDRNKWRLARVKERKRKEALEGGKPEETCTSESDQQDTPMDNNGEGVCDEDS